MHASNIIRFALLIAACAQALPTQRDITSDIAPEAAWEENAIEPAEDILLPEDQLEEDAIVEKREAKGGRPAAPKPPSTKPPGGSNKPSWEISVDPLAPLQLIPLLQQQQQPPAPVQKREARGGRPKPPSTKPPGGSNKPSWEISVDPLAPLQLIPLLQQQQQQQPPAPVQKREAAWGRRPAAPKPPSTKPPGNSNKPSWEISVDPLAPLPLIPLLQQQQQQPPAPVQKREARRGGSGGRRPSIDLGLPFDILPAVLPFTQPAPPAQ